MELFNGRHEYCKCMHKYKAYTILNYLSADTHNSDACKNIKPINFELFNSRYEKCKCMHKYALPILNYLTTDTNNANTCINIKPIKFCII